MVGVLGCLAGVLCGFVGSLVCFCSACFGGFLVVVVVFRLVFFVLVGAWIFLLFFFFLLVDFGGVLFLVGLVWGRRLVFCVCFCSLAIVWLDLGVLGSLLVGGVFGSWLECCWFLDCVFVAGEFLFVGCRGVWLVSGSDFCCGCLRLLLAAVVFLFRWVVFWSCVVLGWWGFVAG